MEKPIKQGFVWLWDTAVRENTLGAYLAVPTLQNLDGVVADCLGNEFVKELKRDKRMMVSHEGASLTFDLLTERIDTSSSYQGPALVMYPNARLLEKMDDDDRVTDVLVVPWIMADIEEWIQIWRAQQLGMEGEQLREPEFSDPVVEAALKTLTIRVNLSTGIAHPSDRDLAVWVFLRLNLARILYDPVEIKGWLVRHGWKSRHADAVKEVATKIQSGKRVRINSRREMLVDNIVEIWRESALKS
ncbi:MAG: hypothetical protein OXG39_11445 [Chloroflexi bacterium]|nr:hypothetical protein [Chloroflexota bacterium]